MFDVMCHVCRRKADELWYVVQHAKERGISPDEYIRKYDPTYDSHQFFTCEYCDPKVIFQEVED